MKITGIFTFVTIAAALFSILTVTQAGPAIECIQNSDCSSSMICFYSHKCVDPCKISPDEHADCKVENHASLSRCHLGYRYSMKSMKCEPAF